MLRAVRLSAELGFEIESLTKEAIIKSASLISQASPERLANEIYLILAFPDSATYIDQLEKLRLLEQIFPEIIPLKNLNQQGYHHLSGWEHTLMALKELEKITAHLQDFFPRWHDQINEYLQEIIAANHTRMANLKLATLLHDLGKPGTKQIKGITGKVTFYSHDQVGAQLAGQIGHRLRLSHKEIGLLKVIIGGHMRPGFLVEAEVITERALYRFFRDLGNEGVATLILSLADRYAALSGKVSQKTLNHHYQDISFILDNFYQPSHRIIPPRILKGDEIMERFSLKPGQRIGQLLSMVEAALVDGRITNKEEALDFLNEVLSQG